MRAQAALLGIVVLMSIAATAAAAMWRSTSFLSASTESQVLGEGPQPVEVAAVPALIPAEGLLGGLVRTDSLGNTPVAVAWLTPEYLRTSPQAGLNFDPQRYLLFQIALYSRDLKMSAWDLKGMIYLRDGSSKEYGSPAWIPTDHGERKAGLAAFPSRDARDKPVPARGSKSMEIVIRDLGGVKERAFRWELDR